MLTGRINHYRGARGLEEQVGCMSLPEGGAEVAYTGGCADGVGEVGGQQTRKKYYTLALCSARIQPPSIATTRTR